MKKPSFHIIRPLLLTGEKSSSRWFSYIGLGIGVLLLLLSLQLYIDIQSLVKQTSIRKNGLDYISVTKTITNANMGLDNRFSPADLDTLREQPFIQGAAPLISNRFEVVASAGDRIPFSTDIFLESLETEFIDTVPPEFDWKPGQTVVPLIFSSDFLEMYNVFAPSYGLPQLSMETASNVVIGLRCEGLKGGQVFRAQIVAFSDRINSLLVPKSFLDWANMEFEGLPSANASRVFIKTKDANNPELLEFLAKKKYRVNKEKTAFGRSKQVLQGVIAGLGIFGVLVIGLALLLFSFYLQLMVARSRDNLQLLLTIGYRPDWLSRQVARRFIPVYIIVVAISLVLTQLMQYGFHQFLMFNRPELSSWLDPTVWVAAIILAALSIFTNLRMIKKLLYKIL
ncbi:MAG: hypothetical protein ACO3AY_03510 [Chitinophagaceae bacterium]